MKKLLFSLFLISTFLGCKTEVKEITTEKEVSELDAYFENSTLPAAVMGSITRDGEMQWRAFGPALWDGTETVNENNIFRIFSMTKAIASVAALQLVERGQIGLDDPLNELMPEMVSIPILDADGELYTSEAIITLRHLLTHTAGFGYKFLDARLQQFDTNGWEYADLPRLFEPGARWQYGTNTDWVGKVVEKVSGQDLEAYLREHITGPLEMNSTWFNVPEELSDKIVSWGTRDSTGFSQYPRISEPVTSYEAGGGLFASPKDYLTFLRCILKNGKYEGGQILKPESVAMLFRNQLPDGLTMDHDLPEGGLPPSVGQYPDESDTFSLAWALENSTDEIVRSRGSAYWAGIANSFYSVDTTTGVAVVYFTQFLPFNDKETYDFYRLFEKEVYSKVRVDE
jgi:CubicO group peptidase (beta-lactamase class C family)